jgi:hypothetical protein
MLGFNNLGGDENNKRMELVAGLKIIAATKTLYGVGE